MKKLLILLAILFSSSIIYAQTQKTYIDYYNNTSKTIFFAYALWDRAHGCYTSKGWFVIDPYTTTHINIEDYTGEAYIHAQDSWDDSGSSWGDVKFLCVDLDNANFEIRDAVNTNCKTKKMFFLTHFTPGSNSWTFDPPPPVKMHNAHTRPVHHPTK